MVELVVFGACLESIRRGCNDGWAPVRLAGSEECSAAERSDREATMRHFIVSVASGDGLDTDASIEGSEGGDDGDTLTDCDPRVLVSIDQLSAMVLTGADREVAR
jgi:hypothetical protein